MSVGYLCYNLISRSCFVYSRQCRSYDSFGIVVVAPTRILKFKFVAFYFKLLTLLITHNGVPFFEWRKIAQKNIWRSHRSSLEHSNFSKMLTWYKQTQMNPQVLVAGVLLYHSTLCSCVTFSLTFHFWHASLTSFILISNWGSPLNKTCWLENL